jgi:2-oxoacid:acceptor oxidoreductase delta subunit (pyruvate/2-ketoisovalerate family)
VGIKGEETIGVETAIRFLERVNSGTHEKLSGSVAIIGGGYTAVDVARSAVRLGAEPLIFYNRSYEEMPAIREEINEAEHEGVEINFLMAPKEISRSGRGLKLTLQKLTLSKKDDSGARHPIPIRGTEHDITVSKIVLAVGEDPDLSFLPPSLRKDPACLATQKTLQTGIPNVFAGGDCTDDRRAMADAIGAGRRAALAIDLYLEGERPGEEVKESQLSRYSGMNLDYFPRTLPLERKQITTRRRLGTFAEVNLGSSPAAALREARRCFSCGVCTRCDNCWAFCPDVAVSRSDGTYSVNADYCKGCGICVQECPRDAIHMVLRESTI